MSMAAAGNHSKKRSHDDTDLDERSSEEEISPRTPNISPDNIHGKDIQMKDPMTGSHKTVESQPGVSMQEQLVNENKRVVESKFHEALSSSSQPEDRSQARYSFKRQRSDTLISANALDPLKMTDGSAISMSETSGTRNFAQLIGVGWTAIEDEPDTISAWRGIAKGVEKSEGISDATVEAKNQSIDACLVKATQGWYLVRTTANVCQFLGHTEDEAFRNMPHSIGQIADSPPSTDPSLSLASSSVAEGSSHQTSLHSDMNSQNAEDTANQMDVD